MYISIGITGLIVAANFGVMIKMTVTKIKEKWRMKKSKKLQKTVQKYKTIDRKLDATIPVTPLAIIEEEQELRLESINSEDKQEFE